MDDPSAWLAEDFQGKEDSYTYHFTEQDLREIRDAITKIEAKGLRIEVGSPVLISPAAHTLSTWLQLTQRANQNCCCCPKIRAMPRICCISWPSGV